jgi:hypothetical protein
MFTKKVSSYTIKLLYFIYRENDFIAEVTQESHLTTTQIQMIPMHIAAERLRRSTGEVLGSNYSQRQMVSKVT